MKKIKLVVDSACDLDVEVIKKLGAEVAPLTLNFCGEVYEDRVTITTGEFYSKLEATSDLPTTSQVTPGVFHDMFKKILDEGNRVLYIGFSSRLSGTYQSATIAKDMLQSEDIELIDSKAASVGYGLMVIEASKMIKEGRSLEDIKERILNMTGRMEHIFAVGNLEMLKRGGRISRAQALMGTLLNVKPILQFEDGYIVPYDKVRGEKAIIKKMIETMKERGGTLEDQNVIGFSYSQSDRLCGELKEEIIKEFGPKDFIISEIGAVIGSHVGGGTTAVFFLNKK